MCDTLAEYSKAKAEYEMLCKRLARQAERGRISTTKYSEGINLLWKVFKLCWPDETVHMLLNPKP